MSYAHDIDLGHDGGVDRPAAALPEIVIYTFFPYRLLVPSTSFGLARALAAHTRVWYVSRPYTYKDAMYDPRGVRSWTGARVRVVEGFDGNLMEVDLPPTAPINSLPEGSLYDRIAAMTDARQSRALRRALLAHGVGDYLWVNVYAPTQMLDVELHRPPLGRIYYSVDAIAEARWTGRHGKASEARQMAVADMGLGTSTQLAEDLRTLPVICRGAAPSSPAERPPVHVLPNAAAAESFLDVTELDVPDDLAALPAGPRIGYIGNLDGGRVDFGLIERVALARPDAQVVLIGPWNGSAEWRERLDAHANVHFFGPRPQPECPPYLANFDCGLIPFKLSPLTYAIYPLKINEYLAIGVSVLATDFSPDILEFADVAYVVPAERWTEVLDEALEDNGTEAVARRRERARRGTWKARAQSFFELTAPLYAQTHTIEA